MFSAAQPSVPGGKVSKAQGNFLEELSKRKMASTETRMSAIEEANRVKNTSSSKPEYASDR